MGWGIKQASQIVLFAVLVFSLGWITSALFFVSAVYQQQGEIPEINLHKTSPLRPLTGLFVLAPEEVLSSSDHVPEDAIKVYDNRVELLLDNPSWSSFTDTNSMDPLLDTGSNAIEIKPRFATDVHVGDVISYRLGKSSVTHRVIEVGSDQQGIYYIVKGDNNPVEDSKKVRFEQIEGIVVAVVY